VYYLLYWTKGGDQKLITSKVLASRFNAATRNIKLAQHGIDPDKLSIPSLQASQRRKSITLSQQTGNRHTPNG